MWGDTLLNSPEVTQTGDDSGDGSVDRSADHGRSVGAGASVTNTVAVVVAVVLVAAALFVVVADNALRNRSEVPDVLRPIAIPDPSMRTGSDVVPGQLTPGSVTIELPLSEVSAPVIPTPTGAPGRSGRLAKFRAHIVESGDTLAGIASGSGLSFEEIAAVNGIDEPFTIQIGETILIPNR